MVISPLAGKEVEVSEVQLSLKDRQTRMSIGTTNCDNQLKLESTGEFWKRVYNLLEANFEVLVINAQHIKNVPGRKQAVIGRVRDHHRFLIASHLTHLDFLEEQIAVFDAKIIEHIQSHTPPSDLPSPGDGSSIAQLSSTPDLSSPPTAASWEQSIALLDTIFLDSG